MDNITKFNLALSLFNTIALLIFIYVLSIDYDDAPINTQTNKKPLKTKIKQVLSPLTPKQRATDRKLAAKDVDMFD